LVAAGTQIDDAETAMGERNPGRIVDMSPLVVRSSMRDRVGHCGDIGNVTARPRREMPASNAAHGLRAPYRHVGLDSGQSPESLVGSP